MINRLFFRKPPAPPPLIHLTHAKAGSTWMDCILRELYGAHVAPRGYDLPPVFDLKTYKVFSAKFMTREQFLAHSELTGIHRFLVIRDLRDTLISHYFSVRDTHELDPAGIIARHRDVLRAVSCEEGLAYILREVLEAHAVIQRSWLGAEIIRLRYEDLIRADLPMLRKLFLDTFGHPISERRLEGVIAANRFENVFNRKLGEEDRNSHGRKGEPGDWQNHFTPKLRAMFHEKYGDLLIANGYEADDSWVRAEQPLGQATL